MPKKGRTFDGCWTCRSRKVKCDLTKPYCQRCTKSKRKCKGYDIKLRWSNPLSISKIDSSMVYLNSEDSDLDSSSFQRRNIELVKFPKSMSFETYAKLNEILEKLDNFGTLDKNFKIGPFRCFKMGIRRTAQENEGATQKEEEEEIEVEGDAEVEVDNSHVHYNLINFSKLTVLGIKGINYKFNDQNMLHILYPKFFPNIDSDDDWSIFYESTKSISKFNYQISEIDEEVNYSDLKDTYNLINDLSEDEENESLTSDDEEEDQIEKFKPTIQNLISKEKMYSPLQFTISFGKQSSISAFERLEKQHQGHDQPPRAQFNASNVHFSSAFIENNLMYLTYGISKSLIDIFHQIIHLTNHKNIFSQKKVFPRNFPKICAEIEDKLINWKIPWILNESNPIHQILKYSLTAFQKAQIVYFNKLLKKNFDIKGIQKVIIGCLDDVEKSLQIANSIKFEYKPNFWILLICGSSVIDKDLQEKIRLIWQNDLFKRQSNYWRGKQILYEIWNRRALGEDENNLGFMNLIREWDIVLSLG
ncbi:unnamed protein product [Candida verbasci]|uniref:Zn(2)-C6 fungal-type domain-containing protein n=1 Tax=Candida verbasci TaxID=1227364 RepID=A0A9W4TZL7_9ASCO|nr:unnamed protein product [Candida verbasci]